MKANAKSGEKIINFNINDNKVEYTLGNGRKIAFDTGDLNLPNRIFEATNKIADYMDEQKKEMGISTPEDVKKMKLENIEEVLKKLNEHDKTVRSYINEAFNTCNPDEEGYQDICYAAFGTANCVSPSRKTGNCYYEDFLECLYPIIEAEYGVRAEKLSKKVEKYTNNKGKHSKQ